MTARMQRDTDDIRREAPDNGDISRADDNVPDSGRGDVTLSSIYMSAVEDTLDGEPGEQDPMLERKELQNVEGSPLRPIDPRRISNIDGSVVQGARESYVKKKRRNSSRRRRKPSSLSRTGSWKEAKEEVKNRLQMLRPRSPSASDNDPKLQYSLTMVRTYNTYENLMLALYKI